MRSVLVNHRWLPGGPLQSIWGPAHSRTFFVGRCLPDIFQCAVFLSLRLDLKLSSSITLQSSTFSEETRDHGDDNLFNQLQLLSASDKACWPFLERISNGYSVEYVGSESPQARAGSQ